ncbi:MAG TPA: preprotein translocase subunit SecA [Candidatus Paceibacterota bacterium]|nr:preprotein translocase subunit SecA [Candidatus Paceibacterota bacterium]
MSFINNFFSPIKKYHSRIEQINALEKGVRLLTNEDIKKRSLTLKEKIGGDSLKISDDILNEGFAIVRETARRSLGQRHYDVQLIGGLALFEGKIAEMSTGEGKTLAATAPAYIHGLTGKGVHIVTVNDYLAQRDAIWMGQIYDALGLSVSCLIHDAAYMYDPNWHITEQGDQLIDKERDTTGSFRVQKEYLKPISRKEAYLADIVYGTNHEFGFDYLRDNLAYSTTNQVQRQPYFAIIDEVDSILIDEARTPLIISAPDTQAAEFYKMFAKIVLNLQKETDYTVDEKNRSAQILPDGITKIEKMLNIENLYDSQNLRLVHYLEESLKAKALFFKDRHYVVKNGEIVIVDEFTGRLMFGRRYSGGLHQAIEAKEGVRVQEEQKTFAQITLQNYFKLYERISGMTGTAETSSEEFHRVYGLEVLTIPTNKPSQRKNLPDFVYKNKESKYKAIVKEIKERNEKKQPVLIGTTSIDENQIISANLSNAGIKHEVLNAKNHEREGEIIAQAGRLGAVTLATNMAGRGVDIVLGGNPQDPIEAQEVKNCGGLFVLGTERNEARRIDNQLRGRSGRQGDPGESRFFLSLEDELLRIFGGERIKSLMTTLKMPEDVPIESGFVAKVVDEAQKKVEGINFDVRRHLLDYDTVLNKQRSAVYRRRQSFLERIEKGEIQKVLEEITLSVCSRISTQTSKEEFEKWLLDSGIINENKLITEDEFNLVASGELPKSVSEKIVEVSKNMQTGLRIIASIDVFWTNHLENLEALMESVRMRAYGQKDPLVEYKRESFDLFKNLIANAEEWTVSNVFKLENKNTEPVEVVMPASKDEPKIGRNDLCPCGSGKKYKKCHGK